MIAPSNQWRRYGRKMTKQQQLTKAAAPTIAKIIGMPAVSTLMRPEIVELRNRTIYWTGKKWKTIEHEKSWAWHWIGKGILLLTLFSAFALGFTVTFFGGFWYSVDSGLSFFIVTTLAIALIFARAELKGYVAPLGR